MQTDIDRARQILPPRTRMPNTRRTQLARRQALRLYLSGLPPELLMQTFEWFPYDVYMYPSRRGRREHHVPVLTNCSSVCRRWARTAQARLFKVVVTGDLGQNRTRFALLHRAIMDPANLGVWVKTLDINFRLGAPQQPMPISQGIIDCLRRVPNVESLLLGVDDSEAITDELMSCIQSLPKLTELFFDQFNYLDRPINTSNFEPALLSSLPPLQVLCLKYPFLDVVHVMADALRTMHPLPTPDSPARPNSGLKTLRIRSYIPVTGAIDFPTLISATSLPATLVTLELDLSHDPEYTELVPWIPFIAACTQLEELDVGALAMPAHILHSLPIPKRLSVLGTKMVIITPPNGRDPAEWDVFTDNMVAYVAKATSVKDFRMFVFLEGYPADALDSFIRRLLPATSNEDCCRLEKLKIDVGAADLVKIHRLQPREILDNFDFQHPHIETIELLCSKAKMLTHLTIPVPHDSSARLSVALDTLPKLRLAKLESFPVDRCKALRGTPLSKQMEYQFFLELLKILAERLAEALEARQNGFL